MLTHIDLDEEKIKEIMELMNFKTKKEAVNAALEVMLNNLKRMEVLKWKGSNAWEGDLDEMRRD
jgi:Arc/MetJ family transcription regulator